MSEESQLSVREVVEKLDQLRELSVEEWLGEIALCVRSDTLEAKFFGVVAVSDRMLMEFGAALDSSPKKHWEGFAGCLLVLLDDVVRNYARFTHRIMVEDDSLASKSQFFPLLSLLSSLRPWMENVLPSDDLEAEDAES